MSDWMQATLVAIGGISFIAVMTGAAILRDRMDQRQARAKHRWTPKHRLVKA